MIDIGALKTQSPITWVKDDGNYSMVENCMIAGQMVAWLMVRPSYCDRGHWQVGCELPDLDAHDCFPRYYMSHATAKAETEAFLKWRLWKIRHQIPIKESLAPIV